MWVFAALAQLVEQFIRNEKVASSIPASGTRDSSESPFICKGKRVFCLMRHTRHKESRASVFFLWHSQIMKALKSPLANELLADEQARNELRRFLISNHSRSASSVSQAGRIQVRRGTSAITVSATVVPKAKAD